MEGVTALVNARKAQLQSEVDGFFATLPQKCEHVHGALSRVFPLSTSQEVSELFHKEELARAEKLEFGENPHMAQALGEVRGAALEASQSFELLSQWISLHIPRCESGNNFGVEVQEYVLKIAKEAKNHVNGLAAQIPDYHWKRAEGTSRFVGERWEESEQLEEDVDKKDDKSHTSKRTSKSLNKRNNAHKAYLAFVVAFDVDWYFRARMMLQEVLGCYLRVADAVSKHADMVTDPRNTGQGYSQGESRMAMF